MKMIYKKLIRHVTGKTVVSAHDKINGITLFISRLVTKSTHERPVQTHVRYTKYFINNVTACVWMTNIYMSLRFLRLI